MARATRARRDAGADGAGEEHDELPASRATRARTRGGEGAAPAKRASPAAAQRERVPPPRKAAPPPPSKQAPGGRARNVTAGATPHPGRKSAGRAGARDEDEELEAAETDEEDAPEALASEEDDDKNGVIL